MWQLAGGTICVTFRVVSGKERNSERGLDVAIKPAISVWMNQKVPKKVDVEIKTKMKIPSLKARSDFFNQLGPWTLMLVLGLLECGRYFECIRRKATTIAHTRRAFLNLSRGSEPKGKASLKIAFTERTLIFKEISSLSGESSVMERMCLQTGFRILIAFCVDLIFCGRCWLLGKV